RGRPWLSSELALATVEPAPLTVAWDSSDPSLPIGAASSARLKVTRSPGIAGPVRLALLTSQIVPRTADGKQEDRNRALRVEGTPTIPTDQTAGALRIVVPGDLPFLPYDLVVRAELLSADGKQVVASALTPSRRIGTSQPIALQLTGPAAVEAKAGL